MVVIEKIVPVRQLLIEIMFLFLGCFFLVEPDLLYDGYIMYILCPAVLLCF